MRENRGDVASSPVILHISASEDRVLAHHVQRAIQCIRPGTDVVIAEGPDHPTDALAVREPVSWPESGLAEHLPAWRPADRFIARDPEAAFRSATRMGTSAVAVEGALERQLRGWYDFLDIEWSPEASQVSLREANVGQRRDVWGVLRDGVPLDSLVASFTISVTGGESVLSIDDPTSADTHALTELARTGWSGSVVLSGVGDPAGEFVVSQIWRGFPDWVQVEATHSGTMTARACGFDPEAVACRDDPLPWRARQADSYEYIPCPAPESPTGEPASQTCESQPRPVADARTAALDLARSGDPSVGQQPSQVRLTNQLSTALDEVKGLAERFSLRWERPLTLATSVKTNPQAGWLRMACEAGLVAECISLAEVAHAAALGFDTREIILNGPGKWWPALDGRHRELGAVFADSVGDLHRSAALLDAGTVRAGVLGVRIRPEGVTSRFGVRLHQGPVRAAVADVVRPAPGRAELGIHMNVSATAVGVRQWVAAARSTLASAARLQEASCRPITVVDFGGGWPVDDWPAVQTCLDTATEYALSRLPEVKRFLIEPGRALTQEGFATLMRVISVDASESGHDIVVTGSYWDCPDVQLYPHEILWSSAESGPWFRLAEGADRILGRLCMETDILKHRVALPPAIAEGDFIAVMGTGGYDASLSREFGVGTSRW